MNHILKTINEITFLRNSLNQNESSEKYILKSIHNIQFILDKVIGEIDELNESLIVSQRLNYNTDSVKYVSLKILVEALKPSHNKIIELMDELDDKDIDELSSIYFTLICTSLDSILSRLEISKNSQIQNLKLYGFHSINFDFCHDEPSCYSKEQVDAFITYKGGLIEEYVRHGSGGGNPEFTALVPKTVTKKDFFTVLYQSQHDHEGYPV